MALDRILIPADEKRDARARELVGQVKTWHVVTLKQAWGSFPAGTVCRQTRNGYHVNAVFCECPDYKEWGHICKHIRAYCLFEQQQAEDAAVDLAFAEVATRLRGNGAGVALIRTYESIWTEED